VSHVVIGPNSGRFSKKFGFNLYPQRVAEVIHAVSNNVSSYATAPAATSGAVNTSSSATVAATTITKTSTTATAILTAITATNNAKKSSTATAAPPPPALNSTVLPQQWIMITTLQLFLHLFGSADKVWVNSLPKIPGNQRIILFFIDRRRTWSDWATPPPTTTTVNAHPL